MNYYNIIPNTLQEHLRNSIPKIVLKNVKVSPIRLTYKTAMRFDTHKYY